MAANNTAYLPHALFLFVFGLPIYCADGASQGRLYPDFEK